MATSYLPTGEQERVTWLNTFAKKIPTYAPALGLPAPTVTAVAADAAYYEWVMNAVPTFRDYAQAWTAFKNTLVSGGPKLGDAPATPTLGTAPAAVEPDLFGRLGRLVATIKNAPGYTDAIGQDLGIIAPSAHPLPEALKPALKLVRVAKGVRCAGASTATAASSCGWKWTGAIARAGSFWPSTPSPTMSTPSCPRARPRGSTGRSTAWAMSPPVSGATW